MQNQFSLKSRELQAHLDSPQITQNLLLDLGVEALKENGHWLLFLRERPLEVLSTP